MRGCHHGARRLPTGFLNPESKRKQKKFTLTEGDDNEKKKQMYDETLTKLHNISPKIGYRLKKHLELDNLIRFLFRHNIMNSIHIQFIILT